MCKKIVFMGTPDFSIETLNVLAKSDYQLECVYTQPPKKSSRGQKIKKSPVHIISEKLNLEVRHPSSLNEKNEYEYFKSLKAEIVIVVAYGKIIPKEYLDLPKKIFINIHASLLPKWRGAAPIQRSIMNHDRESGVSIMKIEVGLDVGPYMRQIKVKINKKTTTKSLSLELSCLGAATILDCIKLIENDEAKFIEQKNNISSYAKKISKSEAKIDWRENSQKILSKINALNPDPGAWFEFKNSRYKVWEASVVDITGNPGKVMEENLTIACGDKSIQINIIQKEGKNKMSVESFTKGTKITKGENLI